MVVLNQNIAKSNISSILALIRLIGLHTIIPSFLEKYSEIVAAGNQAAQTCLRYKIVAIGYNCPNSVEPSQAAL